MYFSQLFGSLFLRQLGHGALPREDLQGQQQRSVGSTELLGASSDPVGSGTPWRPGGGGETPRARKSPWKIPMENPHGKSPWKIPMGFSRDSIEKNGTSPWKWDDFGGSPYDLAPVGDPDVEALQITEPGIHWSRSSKNSSLGNGDQNCGLIRLRNMVIYEFMLDVR